MKMKKKGEAAAAGQSWPPLVGAGGPRTAAARRGGSERGELETLTQRSSPRRTVASGS